MSSKTKFVIIFIMLFAFLSASQNAPKVDKDFDNSLKEKHKPEKQILPLLDKDSEHTSFSESTPLRVDYRVESEIETEEVATEDDDPLERNSAEVGVRDEEDKIVGLETGDSIESARDADVEQNKLDPFTARLRQRNENEREDKIGEEQQKVSEEVNRAILKGEVLRLKLSVLMLLLLVTVLFWRYVFGSFLFN